MILKPFMLRRIKKDVENELSDKIEVMVYCPLTTRQKLLYSGVLICYIVLCEYILYWYIILVAYSTEEKDSYRGLASLHSWWW